jgi:5'-nucleotidase
LPDDTLLNVNVPNLPADEMKGVAVTRQSARRYLSALERRTDPRGMTYYWLTGQRGSTPDEAGTDAWALAAGFISVTPVQLNMTDERLLRALESWGLDVP